MNFVAGIFKNTAEAREIEEKEKIKKEVKNGRK